MLARHDTTRKHHARLTCVSMVRRPIVPRRSICGACVGTAIAAGSCVLVFAVKPCLRFGQARCWVRFSVDGARSVGPLEVDDDVAKVNVRTPRSAPVKALVTLLTLALFVGLQSLLMAPDRLAPWLPDVWTRSIDVVEGATLQDGAATAPPLVERLRRLQDPLGTSGGRLGAWMLTREMIATRPTLGFGFDAIERVYAPGAASELAHPLAHPHHGILSMLLQGGALFTVAVLVLLAGLAWRLLWAAIRGDAVAALIAAAFLGLVAMELLDSVLRVGAVGGVALVVLVMGAGSSEPNADATPAPPPPAPS